MKLSPLSIVILVVFLLLAPALLAQSPDSANQNAVSPAPSASAAEVPRLIKFGGTLLNEQDRPMTGPVGVTFALYSQQTGGAALWIETQNVTPDASGVYSVLLGASSANGVPAELFASAEARWLAVQVERQAEQSRVLLVSVPYALKAKDAETLGGKPASAFVTTETVAGTANSAGSAAAPSSSTTSTVLPNSKAQTTPKKAASTPQPATACSSVTSDGIAAVNSIATFTTACNIESSVITQSGSNVGIGTAAPAVALDVVGNNAGLRLSGTGTHQVTVTGATSGRLGQDSSGFFFASDTNGKTVRFLTNNGTLNEWMRITSAGKVGIGTTTPLATLDVAGSLNLPDTASGGPQGVPTAGAISLGMQPFVHDCCPSLSAANNTFVGQMAGNFTMTGSNNSGFGFDVLQTNTTGADNTALGFQALRQNTTGNNNTAIGVSALGASTGSFNTAVGQNAGVNSKTGSNNTFIGASTGQTNFGTQLMNATALGAHALVNCSNCMVLGDSTMPMNVGIGTTTPGKTLDVVGDIRTTSCYLVNSTVVSGTCVSDVRLKANIQPFSPVLDKLTRLQPVHFDWRVTDYPERHFDRSRSTGLIAQEVEKVFPELVSVDAQGFKQVNYTELPYLMLQAIRELKAENDRLQRRVEELRAKDREVTGLARQVDDLRAVVAQMVAAQQRAERAAGDSSTPAGRK